MKKFIILLLILIACLKGLPEKNDGNANRFYAKLSWSRIHSFPPDFNFEGDVSGYISIFKTNSSWHVYFYMSRNAMIDHDETAFAKVCDIEFRNSLGIQEFNGNEKLMKSLDGRYVRIAGKFRTSASSYYDVPLFVDQIRSISWRAKDGTWTNDQSNGLDVSQLKDGRKLAFPDAEFFRHE